MSYPSNEPDVVTAEDLLTIVERIESVEDQMRGLRGDRSEIYAEAKGRGYDTRTIKKVVAWKKRDPGDVAEEEALFDTYVAALDGVVK